MKFLKFNHTYSFTQKILALFAIALVIVAIVTSIFAYRIGHKQGAKSATAMMMSETEDGQSQVTSIQVASLKQQLDSIVQERDISLSNLSTLREQNDSLKTKNLQLKQLNDLLLDNVAKEGGVPLKLLAAEITALPDRTYEYRFDVAMIDKSGGAVTTLPKLTLLNATSEANIALPTQEVRGITYIRGKFVMPKGFEPKQMRVELKTGGQERVVQLYNWSVGKPVAVSEDRGISERPIGTN